MALYAQHFVSDARWRKPHWWNAQSVLREIVHGVSSLSKALTINILCLACLQMGRLISGTCRSHFVHHVPMHTLIPTTSESLTDTQTHERGVLPQSSPGMDFDVDRSSSPLPEFPMRDLLNSEGVTLAPSQQGRFMTVLYYRNTHAPLAPSPSQGQTHRTWKLKLISRVGICGFHCSLKELISS